jgi:hypothetical protein
MNALPQKTNRGQFRKGPDPRRHKFTRNECIKGFWAAIYSVVRRYPDAIGADGRHMAVNFLKSKREEKVR